MRKTTTLLLFLFSAGCGEELDPECLQTSDCPAHEFCRNGACVDRRAAADFAALHLVGHQASSSGCTWDLEEPVELISRGTLDLVLAETYLLHARVKMAPEQVQPIVLRRAVVEPAPPAGLGEGAEAFSPFEAIVAGSVEPGGAQVVQIPLLREEQAAALAEWLPPRSPDDPSPSTELAVEVQLFGEELNGDDANSNVFGLPLVVCNGCLLRFPSSASAPGPPNCRDVEGVENIEPPCIVGQDEPVDCRLCRVSKPIASRTDCEPM